MRDPSRNIIETVLAVTLIIVITLTVMAAFHPAALHARIFTAEHRHG